MRNERNQVTTDAVREKLREIVDPCSAARGTDNDVISMGLLDSIEIDGTDVTVQMRLTSPTCFMVPYFIRETEERVGGLEGVDSVTLETDAGMEWQPSMMSEDAKRRREEYLDGLRNKYELES
jgi:metal-sulfur cluster biosynthetic enzyme